MSCCDSGAAYEPICAYRTADFQEAWRYTGFDITGWVLTLRVASAYGVAPVFTVSTTINANLSVITLTDAAEGEFEILIREEDIALVPAATPASDPVTYVYTITVTDVDGLEAVFSNGPFTVLAGI